MNDKGLLTPILVFAAGRSGTTLMMNTLSCSDEIHFHKQYPFESPDLLYLFRMAQMATTVEGFSTTRNDLFKNALTSIGRHRFRDNENTFFNMGEESLALVFQSLWAGYSAEAKKRGDYRFYAEKIPPNLYPTLAKVVAGKNIFLFRDPRAEMLSIMRFNKKRNNTKFGWRENDTAEDFALRFCVKRRKQMVDLANLQEDENHMKLFYEDFVANFENKLQALEDFLQTKINREALQANLSAFGDHMTSTDAISSINDWERELPETVKDIFAAKLGKELTALGYRV